MRRLLLIVLIIVAIGAAIYFGQKWWKKMNCSCKDKPAVTPPPDGTVTVTTITQETVDGAGTDGGTRAEFPNVPYTCADGSNGVVDGDVFHAPVHEGGFGSSYTLAISELCGGNGIINGIGFGSMATTATARM